MYKNYGNLGGTARIEKLVPMDKTSLFYFRKECEGNEEGI